MAGKDIDLVIRAKDRASSELEKISKALKKNVDEQIGLARGADKTSAALGKLATDAAKFERELDKLKSAGKVAAELDKATGAVSRMESSLKTSAGELAKMARESDAAAQAANRLKGHLAAEESALASNKNSLKESRAELKEVAKAIALAERNQQSYNRALAQRPATTRGVGVEAGAARSSARDSAATFIAADLANAQAAQVRATQQVKEYEAAVKQSTDSVRALRPEVSAASSLQNQLTTQTERASQALSAEKETLGQARTELASIRDVSAKAGEALGGVALSQEQVSAAAARMNSNLARTQEALAAYSKFAGGGGSFVDPKTAASLQRQNTAVEQARADMKALQAETSRLAVELKNVSGNATQEVNAFNRMSAASRAAEAEFRKQVATLNQMRGVSQTTFASWARATIPLQQVASTTAQVTAASSQAAGAMRQIAPIVRQTGAAAGEAATKTTAFGFALGGLQKDTRQSLSLMQRLRGELLSLTASYIGFQAALSQVGGAVNSYQQLEAVQSRLGAVFNQDTGKVSAEIQFLQQQSERLGISFSVLADEYGKFTIAADSANFTNKETRKVFLSVAEAARVNKLSVEQTSGVFLALTQMISKGKVTSEELRRQLGDRLPGAFATFAAAIGVTTGQLDKMMQDGEVIADRGTLLKFADQLGKRFGPQLSASLDTISADLGRFETNIFNSQIAVANGFIPALREAIQSFNAFAKSAEGQDTFAAVGRAVGDVVKLLAEVPKYFNLITLAAKAFVAVKVAEAFTGLVGKLLQSAQAFGSFGRELQLVDPRTREAAAAQGFFARGLAQTVSTLGVYRSALLASTSQTAIARAGVVSLAGVFGGLQSVLIATAGIARAFLAAFGGPIGLAITAITFAVGQWITSVNTATSALDQHQRMLDIIVSGYNEAENKAGDWAKKLQGVTLAQAEASVASLKSEFNKAIDDAESLTRVLKAAFSDFGPDASQVQDVKRITQAFEDLRSGAVGIKEVEQSLNDIAMNSVDQQIKEVALELLNMVNNAQEGSKSISDLAKGMAEGEAAIKLMKNTATEADKALLPLPKTIDETTKAMDNGEAVIAYNKALDDLKSKIPQLADELKKLKDITEINKSAWEGLVAAFKLGDFSKLGEVISLWAQARSGVQMEFDRKQYDSLPDSSKKLVDRIIYVEGGQTKKSDTNKSGSSAQGIGQFTENTWLPIFNRLFPALNELTNAQKLEFRYNEQYARPILEELTKQNQIQLTKAGVSPTDANTYLAHFLGSGDAIKVALANPDELASKLVNPKSVAANPTVIKPDTTAGDLRSWALQKVGGGSEIMAGGETKQESLDEGLDQRVKGWKEEANARKESNREGVIAKAIAEEEAKYAKENLTLTQQQRDAIREAAGAKYDSAHADEQLKANQEAAREQLNDIIGLDQQRKNLLQEINMAQNSGDTQHAAELITQLTGVNDQLAAAIPKALELARALGDEKMVAQLQKVQLNTAKIGSQFSFLGLSFNQTKQLATNFADGLVGAFDSFAQSLANGEDAMTALKNAFLQFAADFLRQMATMILKTIIFNALNSAFPGLGIGGGGFPAAPGAGLFHTGGIAGSPTSSRKVSPTWFANATRYHSGGIAGLRPDEVPAVLKKNEEVLTEQDPRHRFNGDKDGKSQAPGNGAGIKQVIVLDPRDLANAMASSHGEQVVMTLLKKNRTTVRQIMGG